MGAPENKLGATFGAPIEAGARPGLKSRQTLCLEGSVFKILQIIITNIF